MLFVLTGGRGGRDTTHTKLLKEHHTEMTEQPTKLFKVFEWASGKKEEKKLLAQCVM